ncbi:hypothetical protein J27TS7_51200 [Paenibacillus dendritiformis]|nr:hypothetical protein J27TS7_51200 [Paenibacillus dendritiformis]
MFLSPISGYTDCRRLIWFTLCREKTCSSSMVRQEDAKLQQIEAEVVNGCNTIRSKRSRNASRIRFEKATAPVQPTLARAT